MSDLRTSMRPAATLQLPSPNPRERIKAHIPRLRRLRSRILRLGMLRPRQPGRLREANVERAAVGSLVRYRSLKHLSTFFILVEAKMAERADAAAGLRRARVNGIAVCIAQRICQAALIPVPRHGS